jgi:hypothetical protein
VVDREPDLDLETGQGEGGTTRDVGQRMMLPESKRVREARGSSIGRMLSLTVESGNGGGGRCCR